MEKGQEYRAGGSKQVIKSVSQKESQCNEHKVGIEFACHEFKVFLVSNKSNFINTDYNSLQAVEYFENKFSCGLPWMRNKTLCSLQEVPNLSIALLNYTCIAHFGCESCNLTESAIEGF